MATVHEKMTAIADPMRTLSGMTDKLSLDEMAAVLTDANDEVSSQADLIAQISTVLEGKAGSGGGITPSGTKQITANGTYDVAAYASAEVNVPTSGTPEAVEQATPSITVSSSGLITASATQTSGYVEAGTKSATKQLTTQAAKTVTPGKSDQTAVASGRYTTGAIIVKGDSALEPGNIRSGVSIFGVPGSYTGGGSVSTLDTCTVTLINNHTNDMYGMVWYYNSVNSEGAPIFVTAFGPGSKTVMAKTVLAIQSTRVTSDPLSCSTEGNVILMADGITTYGDYFVLINVAGTGTITIG